MVNAVLILGALVICGLIAEAVAPLDRTWVFFWLTVLGLGPLGILAAAVAQPRPPADKSRPPLDKPQPRVIAQGRTRCQCARCGAESDLHDPKGFACWRCGERSYIKTTPMEVKL
jgi:hypothetical protein